MPAATVDSSMDRLEIMASLYATATSAWGNPQPDV